MSERIALFILPILFPIAASAGAWGVGSYDNDMAQDWYLDIQGAPIRGIIIERAFDVPPVGYLDVDECSIVFAAAEIIVAKRTGDLGSIPFDGNEWILSLDSPSNLLLEKARLAIGYCLDEARSELAGLWKDSQYFDAWRFGAETMTKRLQ